MLRAHVEKGDPVDVANFCMFLHQRGEAIPAAPKPSPSYEALLIIAHSVAHALDRHGVEMADDPGAAIDQLVESARQQKDPRI
jgi:hypothetical protein